jgi:hypothetical protein
MGNALRRKSAGELGIETLYHYEPVNREYLSATLRDQKIHCSNPAKLNDPWDCRPWFDSKSLDKEDVLLKVVEWHYGQVRLGGIPPLTPHQNEQWITSLRRNQEERANLMESLSKTALHRMLVQRRIYCLTPDPDSTLMWSHYAEQHRGICLEFGVDNDLFRRAKQVVYAPAYPVWLPYEFEERQDRTLEVITTKAEEWAYEKEFRLISVLSGAGTDYLRTRDDFFSLPPRSLKGVVIGAQALPDAIEVINDIVKRHAPGLRIRRAVLLPRQYKLQIVERTQISEPSHKG